MKNEADQCPTDHLHVLNPSAPDYPQLQTTLRAFLSVKPEVIRSGVENRFHFGQASGWLRLWHLNLPFRPKGNSVSQDSAAAPVWSERHWPWTLGQRGELLKKLGRSAGFQQSGRSEREVTLWTMQRHGLCTHVHTQTHT